MDFHRNFIPIHRPMIRLKNKLIYLGCGLAFSVIIAQSPSAQSYNEFIESLEQHPQIEIARQWVRMGNAAQLAGSGQFDPVISGETEQKQWQQKTSYQWIRGEAKQNVFAGHSVRAGFDWGQGPWINPELQTEPNGIPYAGIELALGQGFTMDKRRAEYLKSRAYGALYDNESRAEKNTLFYSASINFVYWLNYKAQLELMQYFKKLAQDRLEALKVAQRTGEKSVMDTVEASIYLQGRILEWREIQLQLNQSQNQLSTYVWDNPQSVSDSVGLQKNKETLTLLLEKALRKKSWELSDSLLNPELIRYQIKSKLLDIETRYRKEFLKPQMQLKYNLLQPKSNAFTAEQMKWSANISFPVFFRTPLGEYRISREQLRMNAMEGTQKRIEWKAKSKALDYKLKIIAEQIVQASLASNLSKTLLEAEQIKFQNGEGTLFLLNSRESKWLENQLKLTEFQTKWLNVYFDWVYTSGQLQYKL